VECLYLNLTSIYRETSGISEVISVIDINACRGGGLAALILKLDTLWGFAVIMTFRQLNNILIQYDGFWNLDFVQNILNN
jgi:hypothetical protein